MINLNGAQHVRTVNQNIYYSQWVSLGSFWFGGGAGEFVYLSDFTGEPHATKYMAYDAIRFIKDGGGAPHLLRRQPAASSPPWALDASGAV